jgi:tetratricopeptide (TPR) repeat protein
MGKKKVVFHTIFNEERHMKAKIILLSLTVMGIIFSACAGSPAPVDRYGAMQPVIQNYSPDGVQPDLLNLNTTNSFQTQYNSNDGSITVLNLGGFQVKIMPMTDGRSRGALNRTNDEFAAVIAKYEADLQNNPRDYDACIVLAGLYIDRGRPGDAESALKYSNQALEISQNDPQALYTRSLAYVEQNENDKALSDLETVLKTNLQSMKGVYYVMGMIYYKDGKVEEAIDAFEKVKAFDPEFVDTDEILKILYSRRG